MIPLSLITGFLGSGKTTLLQAMVDRYQQHRLAYIVNEFGAVDVDGQRLQLSEQQLVRIPGGSIFCRCMAGEFIQGLQTIPNDCADSDGRLDGVIVEASGIADPNVIVEMLRETRLDRVYELRTIVSVVDPGSFLKLIHTLPNIIAQVKACQLAIVNKVDLYGEDEIERAEQEIARINPAARTSRARYCQVDIDVFESVACQDLKGDYAACADPNYVTEVATVEKPIDVERMRAELCPIQSMVYRVKGFVPTTHGWLYVDMSSSGLMTRPASDPGKPGSLVFIVRPEAQQRIKAFVTKLTRGEFAMASGRESGM